MSIVKWALIGLLMLPLAEIAAFLLMAHLIGWFWAIALSISTSFLGVILLRRVGRGDLDRLGRALGRDTSGAPPAWSPAAATLVGGILLVLPGFITDLLGAALLVPPLRRWMLAALAKLLRKPRRRPRDSRLIDLEPGEWRQIADRKHGRRRNSNGGA
jgi:UPF0716 protein FxsA